MQKRFLKPRTFEKIVLFFSFLFGIILIFLFEKKVEYYQKVKMSKQIHLEPKTKITDSYSEKNIDKVTLIVNDISISPDVIKVELGKKVLMEIRVSEGYHNIVIEGYNIQSENIPTNKMGKLIFEASRSGTFKLYSSTGHYLKEPEGTLIVE